MTPELRLRHPGPELLALPWERPLARWERPAVALRDLPVGPSRHLVRFVAADGVLWAVKELPAEVAEHEYTVLRRLEQEALPAVRAGGLVVAGDRAVLLTRYLTGSWQYRRLFARLPPDRAAHRARLLDAMAVLLVDLHRHGIFWGDCSLANTLFSRDGQALQAWMVDAETSEVHSELSAGQRRLDLEILVDNVAAGLLDVAAELGRPPELGSRLIAEAQGIPERYTGLWEALHQQPRFAFGDRYRVEGTVRELNDLGFVVEEVSLAPVDGGGTRLEVTVGDRNHHTRRLRELVGLDVGEGQARVLLDDLRAHHHGLATAREHRLTEREATASWRHDVLAPGMRRAHAALGHVGTAVQAYCDLVEVRWLLSEEAGHDVGDTRALDALRDVADRGVPTDSAARAVVADAATDQFPRPGPYAANP